jgi:hypothetical protein
MTMKNIKLTLASLLIASAPLGLVAACSSDNTTGAGPLNHADGGALDGFVSGNTDGGGGGSTSDAPMVDDSGYNVCAKGIAFDNTRVPGYPNPPQP